MVIFHSYVSLPECKPPFSYGFPMGFPIKTSIFPWFPRFFAIQKGHGTEPTFDLARMGPDQRRSDGIPRAQVGLLITSWSFNIFGGFANSS